MLNQNLNKNQLWDQLCNQLVNLWFCSDWLKNHVIVNIERETNTSNPDTSNSSHTNEVLPSSIEHGGTRPFSNM